MILSAKHRTEKRGDKYIKTNENKYLKSTDKDIDINPFPFQGEEDDFDLFWKLYPRQLKTNKNGFEVYRNRALKSWQAMSEAERLAAIDYVRSGNEITDAPYLLLRKVDFKTGPAVIPVVVPPEETTERELYDLVTEIGGPYAWRNFFDRGGVEIRGREIIPSSNYRAENISSRFSVALFEAGFKLRAA